MKINKILAAGTAATLAVTSLAAVASAEQRTFDMGTSIYSGSSTLNIEGFINKDYQAVKQAEMQYVAFNLNNWGGFFRQWGRSTGDGKSDLLKFNTWIADYVTYPKLIVTGTKTGADAKEYNVVKEYTLQNRKDLGWGIAVLKDDEPTYKAGEFAPAYYDKITEVKLTFGVAFNTTDEYTFNEGIQPKLEGAKRWAIGDSTIYNWNAAQKTFTGVNAVYSDNYDANLTKLAAAGTNSAAAILAFATTNGGYSPSRAMFLGPEYDYAGSLGLDYPYLIQTDYKTKTEPHIYNPDGTLVRDEIFLLSDTRDYRSQTANSKSAISMQEQGSNTQTYEEVKYNKGTIPDQFGGLASQIADFFNKAKTGEIRIKFTAGTVAAGSTWQHGGIPSTEVGLKNVIGDSTKRDFALFFNYNSTTGSLQAETELDLTKGEVVFNIDKILDDLGGLTKGTVTDVYYGLVKGNPIDNTKLQDAGYLPTDHNCDAIEEKPIKADGEDLTQDNEDPDNYAKPYTPTTKINGLAVASVTLVKDEGSVDSAAADDTAAADDATAVAADDDDTAVVADDDDAVVADDDDDDAAVLDDDDDDDAAILDDDDDDDDDDDTAAVIDDDDDDTAANNDVDVVVPTNDNDTNPGTGVALAVVPAILAGAAVVLSKKRK